MKIIKKCKYSEVRHVHVPIEHFVLYIKETAHFLDLTDPCGIIWIRSIADGSGQDPRLHIDKNIYSLLRVFYYEEN